MTSLIINGGFAVVCSWWSYTDFRDGDWKVGIVGALIALVNVVALLT